MRRAKRKTNVTWVEGRRQSTFAIQVPNAFSFPRAGAIATLVMMACTCFDVADAAFNLTISILLLYDRRHLMRAIA